MRNRKMLMIAAVLLCCPILCGSTVHATEAESQTAQKSTLEIQLSPQWAGMEFQLTTESGAHPEIIVADADGILRTELGGSKNYVISCLNASVGNPFFNRTPSPAETEPVDEGVAATEGGASDEDETLGETQDSIDGIPVKHIILFGGGLALAVGGLITMVVFKKRRFTIGDGRGYGDDEEDDD